MTAAPIQSPGRSIALAVYGIPAPQGSKKPVGNRRSKAGNLVPVLVESSKKVKPWRAAVETHARSVAAGIPGWLPLDGPLVAAVVFTLPKPLSAPKRTRTWPVRYPDVSKLLRSTEDALTTAGIWADDARVVEYQRLAKVFPGEDPDALDQPGAVIRVWQLPESGVAA